MDAAVLSGSASVAVQSVFLAAGFGKAFLVLVAASVGGFANAIAGGGSLLTFPTLVWVGIPVVAASATNTAGLWPANLAASVGLRRYLPDRRLVLFLAVPSVTGATVGGVLLLRTSPVVFEVLAPLLMLVATSLFALQGPIVRRVTGRRLPRRPPRFGMAAAIVFQFGVGVYGGFFGAGIGIMMLAALAVAGATDVHQMNSLKNLLAVTINGVAALYFVARGAVLWREAGLMALGAMLGGLAGAGVARHLGPQAVRRAVVVIGAAASASLVLKAIR